MSKSKQQIMDEMEIESGVEPYFTNKEVNWLMDEYAKSQCIAFAQWINDTNWGEKDTWGKHDPPSMPTNDQLYDLFIQHQSQQS